MIVQYTLIWQLFGLLACLPMVSATEVQSFPDITFSAFSQFIEANFDPTISLSTVLMLSLTMIENVGLLSLHGRQHKSIFNGEKSTLATGWIKALARQVLMKVGEEPLIVERCNDTIDDKIRALGIKLDLLAKLLGLYPCNEKGKFTGKIKPISNVGIQPVHIICPDAVVCETATCNPRSLVQHTKLRDIPSVTLIKNFHVYEKVPVLCRCCPECNALYYADHERVKTAIEDKYDKVYLNSAKYLKLGTNLWVDRLFSATALSGFYNFHTSAATYASFWNSTSLFGPGKHTLSRRQVWQAFVQESIRFVASKEQIDFTIQHDLPINEVTKEAYAILGNKGIIQGSLEHSCVECTQRYKVRADFIGTNNHSATVGMDDVDMRNAQVTVDNEGNEHVAPVKMVVVDGIVMGHTVSLILGTQSC